MGTQLHRRPFRHVHPKCPVFHRSWHRLKQCVDAIVKDIRQRELSTEIELRIIHVRCSPPVMWIIPSPYVAFPRTLILDAWKTLAMQNTTSELAVVPGDESLWYLLSLLVGRSAVVFAGRILNHFTGLFLPLVTEMNIPFLVSPLVKSQSEVKLYQVVSLSLRFFLP